MSPIRMLGVAGFAVALGACGLVLLPHGERTALAAEPGQAQHCSGNLAIVVPAKGPPAIRTAFPFPAPAGQPVTAGQSIANCQAWQDFVYENWPAAKDHPGVPDGNATAADFGKPVTDPNAHQTTVWESYATGHEAFAGTKRLHSARKLLALGAGNEFLGNSMHQGGQATIGSPWITAQNKGLVFYDSWVDNDEFDYVNDPDNKLKTAAGQTACAATSPGPGLQLPMPRGLNCKGQPPTGTYNGRYGQGIGAMEIKAAFVDMSMPGAPVFDKTKFLISQADLCYPNTVKPDGAQSGGDCTFLLNKKQFPGWIKKNATVGLVGLHIVHKVVGADQMLWETFEQIDNDPDSTSATGTYTFFKAGQGGPKKPTACTAPNTPKGCTPFDVPAQLIRSAGASFDQFSHLANDDFLEALKKSGNTSSVFQHYRLVQVQWPTRNVPIVQGAQQGCCDEKVGAVVPVPAANTVIESYGQSTSCVQCHGFSSTIAKPNITPLTHSFADGVKSALIDLPGPSFGPHPKSVHRPQTSKLAAEPPVPQPTGTPYFGSYSFLFETAGG